MATKIQALIYILVIVLLVNCSKKEADYPSSYADSASETLSRSENENIETSKENTHANQEINIRKLITSSNLQIRIENLYIGVNKLNEIMDRYGTYASSIYIRENSRNYTLKVPATKYKNFLEEIMEIGKIINYSETTEDVTLRYYDLESRLNTKKELIKTYQNYLNKANNIEEILSVESKIAQLQAEIDDVGRQFRLLNDLVDYSTIKLELLGPITVANYGKKTIGENIKGLMTGFGNYVSTIITILLAIVVYVIPSKIILLLLYLVFFGKIGIIKKVFKFISGKK
jgi:hypothetical protein